MGDLWCQRVNDCPSVSQIKPLYDNAPGVVCNGAFFKFCHLLFEFVVGPSLFLVHNLSNIKRWSRLYEIFFELHVRMYLFLVSEGRLTYHVDGFTGLRLIYRRFYLFQKTHINLNILWHQLPLRNGRRGAICLRYWYSTLSCLVKFNRSLFRRLENCMSIVHCVRQQAYVGPSMRSGWPVTIFSIEIALISKICAANFAKLPDYELRNCGIVCSISGCTARQSIFALFYIKSASENDYFSRQN